MSYNESGNNLKTEPQLQPLNEYASPGQIGGGVGDSELPTDDANNVGHILHGTCQSDNLLGGMGDDTLYGDIGHDTLYGGAGNDVLNGGIDSYYDRDALHGGDGDDTLVSWAGGDTLDGGDGIDMVDYSTRGFYGVAVDLGLGTAKINYGIGDDVLIGIENVVGSISHDTLTGADGANLLDGGGGNDLLVGGDEFVDGGAGFDTFRLEDNAGTGGTFGLSAMNASGRIMGVERIDITGDVDDDNTLTLKAGDVFSTSGSNDLYIEGNAGDTVSVTGSGWTAGADVTIDGQKYRHYVNQDYNLFIDAEIDPQNIIHS